MVGGTSDTNVYFTELFGKVCVGTLGIDENCTVSEENRLLGEYVLAEGGAA